MTTLTALELVDVLIVRSSGTAFEALGREIRSAIVAERIPQPTTLDRVRLAFATAAMACGIPPHIDLTRSFRKNGHAAVHRARYLAMYLLYNGAGLSMHAIAREFGLKGHSTVYHGLGKIAEYVRTDAGFAMRVETAVAQCKSVAAADQGAA